MIFTQIWQLYRIKYVTLPRFRNNKVINKYFYMDKVSYALGLGIGRQLSQMGAEGLDIEDFAQAIKDVLAGAQPKVGDAEAQTLVRDFFDKQEQKQRAAAAERFKATKEEGEKWLADNARKPGVVTLPSGLQYQVLQEGNGKKPTAADTVRCHYEGMLVDGTLFDSSIKRGEPAEFPLGGVIKGWTEGLQLMQEGAKYRFFIPYQLGYGEHGAGQSIPPFAALVFDVELIKVV